MRSNNPVRLKFERGKHAQFKHIHLAYIHISYHARPLRAFIIVCWQMLVCVRTTILAFAPVCTVRNYVLRARAQRQLSARFLNSSLSAVCSAQAFLTLCNFAVLIYTAVDQYFIVHHPTLQLSYDYREICPSAFASALFVYVYMYSRTLIALLAQQQLIRIQLKHKRK